MSGTPRLSELPTDRLIRELILTRRSVEAEEIERILDRIATAPFDPGIVRVPVAERGIRYGNRQLLARDDSLFAHLVRRVGLDPEWAVGTTAEQYVQDLHRAARSSGARLTVYARRGGSMVGILAPTILAVPAARRGPATRSTLLVVFSADRGTLVSGYQTPSHHDPAIPGDALWLP